MTRAECELLSKVLMQTAEMLRFNERRRRKKENKVIELVCLHRESLADI